MKLRNMLVCFMVMLVSLFLIEVNAQSSAPSSFNVNASDLEFLYGSDYLGHGSTLNFSYKKNANGDIIYCTEIHDNMVSSGSEKYTLNGEMDAKFAYVLANGYPNKSISGDNKKDYYITGLAIWYLISPNDSTFSHFNLEKGTYKGYDSYVVKEVAKLVNGAKNYSYTNPAIKINLANNSLTLSSDGKYYVSSAISVKTTGIVGNYTVSLSNAPSGTIVTDKAGNVKNTFGVSETFLVKVPASSIKKLSDEFKVSVSATGTINKAYKYSPDNVNNQSTTVLYPENKSVSDSVTVKYSTTVEVPFLKVDAETKEAISGAELKLSDSNGKVIATWTSTNKAKVITGLVAGSYTLTETKAPEGYKVIETSVKFSIDSEGNILDANGKKQVQIVITNERKTGGVSISKQDITNKEELPGATLVVKDKDGNVIDEWVSTNEPHYIEKLDPGTYTLTETIAPEGYILSTETITFKVKNDGSITKVVMYNAPKGEEIPVEPTSSFKTITSGLIGMLVTLLGGFMIFKNYKKKAVM